MNHVPRESTPQVSRPMMFLFIVGITFGAGSSLVIGFIASLWHRKPPEEPPRE